MCLVCGITFWRMNSLVNWNNESHAEPNQTDKRLAFSNKADHKLGLFGVLGGAAKHWIVNGIFEIKG